MKSIGSIIRVVMVFILVLSLGLFLPVGLVIAEDDDQDGLLNDLENNSITLPHQIKVLIPEVSSTIEPCSDGDERIECVKSGTDEPDLFAIIKPASGSTRFPSVDQPDETKLEDFFSAISKSKEAYGLSISVHPTRQDPPGSSRQLTSNPIQHAVSITENNTDTEPGTPLGQTYEIGTPNDGDTVTIYTMKIYKYVCEECGGKWESGNHCTGNKWNNCKDNSDPPNKYENLVRKFIWWVNNHEVGHDLYLAANPDNPLEPEHYTPEQNVIMSEIPVYVKNEGTWYIPTDFHSDSQQKKHINGIRDDYDYPYE